MKAYKAYYTTTESWKNNNNKNDISCWTLTSQALNKTHIKAIAQQNLGVYVLLANQEGVCLLYSLLSWLNSQTVRYFCGQGCSLLSEEATALEDGLPSKRSSKMSCISCNFHSPSEGVQTCVRKL